MKNNPKSIAPHIPIMVKEICSYIPEGASVIVDGTVGYGGHLEAFLTTFPTIKKAYGIDQDDVAVSYCKEKFRGFEQVSIVKANFSEMPDVIFPAETPVAKASSEAQQVHTACAKTPDFILVDLGISSLHLDGSNRGFSFQKTEPLDMRMDTSLPMSGKNILSTYSKNDLKQMFVEFGELRQVDKFVETLFKRRGSIHTTDDFIAAIKSSFFFRNKRSVYLKTCAKAFQALRIEVNQELHHLQKFLEQLVNVTKPGTRVAVISFHSLEDRMVKRFVKDKASPFEPCHKKVIVASQEEILQNTRATSAKLRVFERTSMPAEPR